MKTYNGTSSNMSSPVVGIATRSGSLLQRSGRILISEDGSLLPLGYRGVVTNTASKVVGSTPTVRLHSNELSKIIEGDILCLSVDGQVSVVWDTLSSSNCLFLTESCDCHCIMCPQPPSQHQAMTYQIAVEMLNLLKPEQVKTICITGGEPTLLGDKLLDVLKTIKKKFDHSFVMLLTNGKNFSNFQFARDFASIGIKDLLVCVSLHSDLEELNDKIAGGKGSFHKTVQGLYNLARFRQRIEIRHVISKLNAHRLEPFAHFLYRNFPFVYHFAFMGMEMKGFAEDNYEDVWIDPYEYRHDLYKAVRHIQRAALEPSIYNIPLCLLEQSAWPFARQSISDWKNSYQEICENCNVKEKCSGFFTTSGELLSPHITAIN
jgi:His-Xaa-Ser system radical SAM maturase HxsC